MMRIDLTYFNTCLRLSYLSCFLTVNTVQHGENSRLRDRNYGLSSVRNFPLCISFPTEMRFSVDITIRYTVKLQNMKQELLLTF